MNEKQKEIMQARETAINFLMYPKLKKAKGQMGKANGSRCCLGHMCKALNINFINEEHHSFELAEKLKMHKQDGSNLLEVPILNSPYYCLMLLNDETSASPQDIGKYLKSVIKGGEDTPFIHIDEFK